MKISMYEKADEPSLSGGPELWVRVLTNEMIDLPRVKRAISEDQGAIWANYADKPSDHYPHWVTPEEKTEHGYKYEDWFIFPKKRSY